MNTKKQLTLATLAACALAWPALGNIRNPVERPLRLQATVTWTFDLQNMGNGRATGYEIGVGTHAGLYVNESAAIWDLDNFAIVSGAGVVTTVTGEQLFWVITPEQPGIQFTGGTGRFENATGSFTVPSMSEPIITVDGATMTMTVTYTGVGTITY